MKWINAFSTVCMVFLSLTGIAQDIPIHWTNTVNVSHNTTAHSISKNINGNSWNAWARSLNLFDDAEPAILNYTADVINGNDNLIIAMGQYATSYGTSSVQFGFAVMPTTITIVHNGVMISNINRTVGQEALSLRRIESSPNVWEMEYVVDGAVVHTVSCSDIEMYAYGLIYEKNQTIEGLMATPIVGVSITDDGCPSTSSGAIDLTISGGIPPYTIDWSNAATTEDITGLAAGSYTISIEDNGGNIFGSTYDVLYTINWTNEHLVTTTPSSIVKTPGSSGGGAGAVSFNQINPGTSGLVKAIPTVGSGTKYFGLSVTNSNNGGTSIEYGFSFSSTNFDIVESGLSIYSSTFVEGDIFTVEKAASGSMSYYKNGVSLPATSSGSVSDTYVLDFACNKPEQGLTYVGVDFCNYTPPTINDIVYAEVKERLDGGYRTALNNQVKFTYRGEYSEQLWNYRIINNVGNTLYDNTDNIITNDISGSNTHYREYYGYYSIDVSGFTPGFYVLEITGPKGDLAYLRFKV